MARRGWAGALLSWRRVGSSLTAEISRARYFVRTEAHEITAHAEVRDPGGRYRVDLGSHATVALARSACEQDAAARCRLEPVVGGPVDMRISAGRERRAKVGGNDDTRQFFRQRAVGR
jgi:hypothetical protein